MIKTQEEAFGPTLQADAEPGGLTDRCHCGTEDDHEPPSFIELANLDFVNDARTCQVLTVNWI